MRKNIIYNGITFDSNLEVICYKLLTKHGISFRYHPEPIFLLPKLRTTYTAYEWGKKGLTKNKTVYGMVYEPDFVGDGFIIETKGLKRPDFMKKWNILKRTLQGSGFSGKLFMPRNEKHILEMIKIIKDDD